MRSKYFLAQIMATLFIIYGLVKFAIPAISRSITGMPFPLPVPGTLILFYMTLTIIALFLYVTFSEEGLKQFTDPIEDLIRGKYSEGAKYAVLALLPLMVGWAVYDTTAPKVAAPASLRIQHPSSNFPKKFETFKNPTENPTDQQIDDFIEQAKENEVVMIPHVAPDVEAYIDVTGQDHMLSAITTEPMKKFLAALESGNVDKEKAKGALLELNLFEGRALYAMNCRPCHGDSGAGDGPMADGFKLRPINFTDNGTIETIVEGYTFWRVANGGPGLPTEATPWDSAMPIWKMNLSEIDRWKIISAEYDLAEKTARIPESHGDEGGGDQQAKKN